MIVGKMRVEVDKLWNAFWTGGITNPVSVIEQINYLLFIRRLDDIEMRNERLASRTGKPVGRLVFSEKQQKLRWSNFKQLKPDAMFKVVQEEVFPFIKNLGTAGKPGISTFSKTLSDAVFMIQKAGLLASAVELISALDLDNADTAGDLYEYLLSKLNTSGINGQFRTPRHIIKMMVELIEPKIGDRICDPACGTAGFLLAALQYILEKNTSPKFVQIDDDGRRHGFVGDRLSEKDRSRFETDTFYGFDFDMTMLRVASMNMWLHGIEVPNISYADTLSKRFMEQDRYDVILANPPFKGSLDYADCSPSLLNELKTKKTELLFLVLALRLLDTGGRAAIIVPDGVLFSATNAHMEMRRLLVQNHQLEAIISMPPGVFKPYAGVSTAVLIFTKGGETDRVWFYDMEHDGLSLDDKRQPIEENDIPDVISCWKSRLDKGSSTSRQARMASVRESMVPLKQERLLLHEAIDKLQFEAVLSEADTGNTSLNQQKNKLNKLDQRIHVLQREFNQLSRQFWVEKVEIVRNKYDLHTKQYRQIEQDDEYYPSAATTLERLSILSRSAQEQVKELEGLLK